MNKGIAYSKGDWLFFLGAGDKLIQKNVLSQVEISLSKSYDLVIGNITYEKDVSNSTSFKKSNKGLFKSHFSNLLWIKNTVHHQSVFYKKQIFYKNKFNINYKVLADYDLNLRLFKNKVKVKKNNICVASCDASGISKQYNWGLYKEGIVVKTNNSNIIFKPFFYLLAILKFCIKNTKST